VFPLGMYAAMSFAVGELAGLAWMRAFARDWTWLAAAAWALVLLDAVRPVSEVPRTPSALWGGRPGRARLKRPAG
jgi:tellurite resistance protein TehA-like permease